MPRKNVKGENEMPAGGTRIRKFAVYKLAPAAAKVFSPFQILSQVYINWQPTNSCVDIMQRTGLLL
jgi:hypothetical protein